MSKKYASNYIKTALSGCELEQPDRHKSGEHFELLDHIYGVVSTQSNKADRALAVESSLKTYDELKPGVIERLMPSHQLPDGVKTYGHGAEWTVIHSKDLKKLPPPEWLIEDKLVKKGLSIVYGASATGKSFYALDLALTVSQTQTVVYMAGEDELGYEQRVTAWEQHNHKDRNELYISLGSVPVLEAHEVKEFIDSVKELNPVLVVVDTLARAMVGGDENSSRDMGFVTRACNKMQRELQCSVLLIHHTNKGGDSERGSGALRANADVMIKISNLDEEVSAECSKTKNQKAFETEFYQKVDVPGTGSVVLVRSERVDISHEKVTRMKDLTQAQAKVLRAIREMQDMEETKTGSIVNVTRLEHASVVRVLKALTAKGLIGQESKRGDYTLTALGETLFTGE